MEGYCPQDEALSLFMTPFESLRYMAMLRGDMGKGLNKRVMHMLQKVGLEEYTNVVNGNCSRSIERKLHTAIAMVTYLCIKTL